MKEEPKLMENRLFQRKLFLAQWLKRYFTYRPREENAHLRRDEIEDNPILNDSAGLDRALASMKKELGEGFDYYHMYSSEFGDLGIAISVDDRAALDAYSLKLEHASKKAKIVENPHEFILKETKLYLIGSKKGPYKMEDGALRHELLSFLIKEKKFIPTKDLATELTILLNHTISTTRIRATIDQIRDKVHVTFGIPRSSIIENRPQGGYRVTNIKIEK